MAEGTDDRIVAMIRKKLQYIQENWTGPQFAQNEASQENLETPTELPPSPEIPPEPEPEQAAPYEGSEQSGRVRDRLEAARSAIQNRRLERQNINDQSRVV